MTSEPEGIQPFDLRLPSRQFVYRWDPLRRALGSTSRPTVPDPPVAGDGYMVVWLREGGEYECPHMEMHLDRPEWSTEGVWAVVPVGAARRWHRALAEAERAEEQMRRTYDEA